MTVRSKRCTQVLAVMLALSMVVGVFLKLEPAQAAGGTATVTACSARARPSP